MLTLLAWAVVGSLAAARDAFAMTELQDDGIAATGTERSLARALSMVEAEFYVREPADGLSGSRASRAIR